MTPGRFALAVGMAFSLFISGVDSTECVNAQTIEVASTADANNLSDALTCTGGGVFDVIWYGSVSIDQTIEVPDGISLTITGSGFSSSLPLDRNASTATILGVKSTSETGMFHVSGASTLTLDKLVLEGGYSDHNAGAGAVKAQGAYGVNQTVNVIDCHFKDNYGHYAGGIFVNDLVVLGIHGNTSFSGNTGGVGGAVAIYNSKLDLYGDNTFRNNTGTSGGALFLVHCDVTIGGNTTITSNTATGRGGAIFANEVNLGINGVAFTNNSAGQSGGAIYVFDSSINIEDAAFAGNSATGDGGAIYVDDSIFNIEDVVLAGNSATINGGAIGAYKTNVTTAGGTAFINNEASESGGSEKCISGLDCPFNVWLRSALA